MIYIRYALLALVLLVAVTIALANRAPVTLALWPDWLGAVIGASYTLTLPLFVVVVGALGVGLVLGLIWEWLRERGLRAEAARQRRELARLQADQGISVPARPAASAPRDDVLAILDEQGPARS